MFLRIPQSARKRPIASTGLAAVVLLLTAAVTWLWAHEGHAPLPTSGVRVDVQKGEIELSEQAQKALGIQTEEVRQQALDDHVAAPAVVMAPPASGKST